MDVGINIIFLLVNTNVLTFPNNIEWLEPASFMASLCYSFQFNDTKAFSR